MTKTSKYGNKPYNDRIYVDFEKKTIRFVPIERKKVFTYYTTFLTSIIMLYVLIFWLPLSFISACLVLFIDINPSLLSVMQIYCLVQLLLMAAYFSLWYWKIEWRKKHYPELNARILIFFRYIFSFGKYKPEKRRLNKEALYNNKFFIPHFKNFFLKYKVTKDFAEQLKNITISNIFHKNPYNWFFVFEFKKKPVDGYLEVEYA